MKEELTKFLFRTNEGKVTIAIIAVFFILFFVSAGNEITTVTETDVIEKYEVQNGDIKETTIVIDSYGVFISGTDYTVDVSPIE
jgi:hypothetical protein